MKSLEEMVRFVQYFVELNLNYDKSGENAYDGSFPVVLLFRKLRTFCP